MVGSRMGCRGGSPEETGQNRLGMTDNIWGDISEELRGSVGDNNHKTWIQPLRLNDVSHGVAEFAVSTSFTGDWVNRNYGDEIVRRFNAREMGVERLRFVVCNASRPSAAKAAHHACEWRRAPLRG